MLKKLQLLCTVALALTYALSAPLFAADRILFAPNEVTVDLGDTFSVFVALDTGVLDAHAYRVHIITDTTLVSIDTVLETNSWASIGSYQFTSKDTVINSQQVYDAFSVYWLPASTINGYVEVAQVKMTAVNLGACSLSFNYFLVKDNADQIIVSEYQNGYIRIGGCPYAGIVKGDINASNTLDIADLTHLVGYMFRSGPDPVPDVGAANFNCIGDIDIADLVYLVSYMFKGGPEPCDLCSIY
jgi:hypothetical protein